MTYQDYETLNIEVGRVYVISPDKYYPSITTVLGATCPADKRRSLERWRERLGHAEADKVSEAAATRGTNMHTMLERFLNHEDIQADTFPPQHVALFKSVKLHLRKITKVLGREVALYSDRLEVAGRCDLIAEHGGELSVIDYKTSTREKTESDIADYWLQACFYACAHNERYETNIQKLVIIMAVEDHLPRVFTKRLDGELLQALKQRINAFYENL